MNWLDELEEKVQAASAEIRRLREANRDLEEKIEALETRVEAEDGDSDWQAERKDVRKRVEKLVQTLEKIATSPE